MSFGIARHSDGNQDGKADDNAEEVGGDAKQVEAILQHGEEQHAEDYAASRTDASNQTSAAEDRYGKHVQFLAVHCRRHRLMHAPRLDEPRDGGEQAEIAVSEELDVENADPDPACRFRLAAE